jgi:hypothetical protein
MEDIRALFIASADKSEVIRDLLAAYEMTINEDVEEYRQKLAELSRLDDIVTASILEADKAFEAARIQRKALFNDLLITESERLEREAQEVAEWTANAIQTLAPRMPESRLTKVKNIVKKLAKIGMIKL